MLPEKSGEITPGRMKRHLEPKQNQNPAVDVTGDGSKVWCCKQQYFIGTWNVRSMNQGKLEVVKHEMERVNIDTLGISELRWTGIGLEDQIANIHWIIGKAREFQENVYFCFIDYAKAFDCVDQNKLCKILQEMGIPDHLTCLLRNLYACQEATVRTGRRTTDWFQIRKGSISRLYIVTLLI